MEIPENREETEAGMRYFPLVARHSFLSIVCILLCTAGKLCILTTFMERDILESF